MFPEAIEIGTLSSEIFSGPLPPPAVLREYEAAHPGLAGEIVAGWRAEGVHRRAIESRLLRLSEIGALAAGLIGIAGVAGGVYAGMHGAAWTGIAVAWGTLASLTGVFLARRGHQHPADATADETGPDGRPPPSRE